VWSPSFKRGNQARVSRAKRQIAAYSIFDEAGKKLVSKAITLTEGLNTFSLPIQIF
jgi:hypothetical protein